MRVAPKIELGSGGLGCGSNHSRYAMAVPVSVSQPPVVKQSVFAENCYTFSTSAWYVPATGTGVRPSYQKNGMAVDIVLRREVCPYKLTGPGMWAVNTAAPGYVGPDDWSVSPSGTAVVAPIPPVTSTSLGVPSSTNNTTTSTP